MRHRWWIFGGGIVWIACGAPAEHAGPTVDTQPVLLAPTGLLQRVARIGVRVLQGNATCDADSGEVLAHEASLVGETSLERAGCLPEGAFCGTVAVPQANAPMTFEVAARDASGAAIALGCTTTRVDAATTAKVAITLAPVLAKASCGNGILEPTEQCERGDAYGCSEACQTSEITLASSQNSDNASEPFLAWTRPPSAETSPLIHVFYTHSSAERPEIRASVFGATLERIGSSELRLAPPSKHVQYAYMQNAWVSYLAEDATVAVMRVDDQLKATRERIVIGSAPIEPGANESRQRAAISASSEHVLVAWVDRDSGSIASRTVDVTGTLGPVNQLSTGTLDAEPRVAFRKGDFVAVWSGQASIKRRFISEAGTPAGDERPVGTQSPTAENPQVAALHDGSFAVAWRDGENVWVERFDPDGLSLDQGGARIATGAMGTVALAALGASKGYAIAWIDVASTHVLGLLLGKTSGFLANSVTGRANAFQVSTAPNHTREAPTATATDGATLIIGWADRSDRSVRARRFPLPAAR